MNWTQTLSSLQTKALDIGLKVLGAVLIWIVGRWLIGWVVRLVRRGLARQKIEPTAAGYAASAISVLFKVILVIALFGYFGVQTTTFAALLAAVGLAIGTAWGGLLSNFAAGAFLVVLRPFKVGDFVSAGGTVGTVEEIGTFVTTMNTPDNVHTIIGNAKIFGDTIQNFSANPFRRVDLVAQVAGNADPQKLIAALSERIARIPNVVTKPAPDVVIMSFTPAGPVMAIRPYCHTDHYWQVYFDTNAAIHEILGSGAFPAPLPVFGIRNLAA